MDRSRFRHRRDERSGRVPVSRNGNDSFRSGNLTADSLPGICAGVVIQRIQRVAMPEEYRRHCGRHIVYFDMFRGRGLYGRVAQIGDVYIGVIVVPSSRGGDATTSKKMLRSDRSWSRRGGQKCF